jgi:hypothetical protein
MLIDSEEKLKIAVLAAVAVALLCDGQLVKGGVLLCLFLPWARIRAVGGWLAGPVIRWRMNRRQAVMAR